MTMCFVFVLGTLLEFAAVHYFTKMGSGEVWNGELESEEEEEETHHLQTKVHYCPFNLVKIGQKKYSITFENQYFECLKYCFSSVIAPRFSDTVS